MFKVSCVWDVLGVYRRHIVTRQCSCGFGEEESRHARFTRRHKRPCCDVVRSLGRKSEPCYHGCYVQGVGRNHALCRFEATQGVERSASVSHGRAAAQIKLQIVKELEPQRFNYCSYVQSSSLECKEKVFESLERLFLQRAML
jgi:hypothetical protein